MEDSDYYDTVWKLEIDDGRQVWKTIHVDPPQKSRGVSELENYLLSKPGNNPESTYENTYPSFCDSSEALKAAVDFYSKVQAPDGHWCGDYGGPMFLLPGFLITNHIVGVELPKEYREELIKYLSNIQNKQDGGFGLHCEDKSTIFGTTMNYIGMRLLGLDKDDLRCQKARNFLLSNGGAVSIPQWGKFWLCIFNCFEYEGLDPIPPEIYYLPSWLPFHPKHWWCHTRMVYLSMAYLYGVKFQAKEDPIIREIRKEIFVEDYKDIQWSRIRNLVHPLDNYKPPSWVWKILTFLVMLYETIHFVWLRTWSVDYCLDHIKYEDKESDFIDIGPVTKYIYLPSKKISISNLSTYFVYFRAMNVLICFLSEGKDSPNFKRHLERCWDYYWISSEGMKVGGENGSQTWDTTFALEAILSTGALAKKYSATVKKAYKFLDRMQVREDHPHREKYFRHPTKGGWPFTIIPQGWIVSDCSAEGLKLCLMISEINNKLDDKMGSLFGPSLSDQRLQDAADLILYMQNGTGGWATYEATGGGAWLETINPSSVFKNIMIDYDHIECSSSCLQALILFRKLFPNYRKKDIKSAIEKGIGFVRSCQGPDGGWYGNWAVCFCYGTWFAVAALTAYGETLDTSPHLRKACMFLASKQMEDGGWGESYLSCVEEKYIHSKRSQIVSTAWALLALMLSDYPDASVVRKGIDLLTRRQMPNGDFPQENISGIFNGNCCISYANYRNIFPIWALGMYESSYKSSHLLTINS